ncbi:DUF928 domain-containing protein [Pantanalinema rosaneae CENA516]|uniref:DUF928 domain-containing protein n=1 Tax=Pantanalinema rosaneae TaxID=1620701 RepID=UPI003D6DE474
MKLFISPLIWSLAIAVPLPGIAREFSVPPDQSQRTLRQFAQQLPTPPDTGSPSRPNRGGGTYFDPLLRSVPIRSIGGGSRGNTYFQLPDPPPGDPPEGRRRGGATRGTVNQGVCPKLPIALTALVPAIGEPTADAAEKPGQVWGNTTQAQPTFWFYTPYPQAADYSVRFELRRDGASNSMYRTSLTLPNQPGIVRLQLPDTVSLEVNQRYRWFLTVDCQPLSDATPVSVEGVIQRVAVNPDLSRSLTNTSALEQAALYAKAGVWYDALTILAELRQQDPQAATNWRTLLKEVGLGDLADKPIVDCCKPESGQSP